MYNMYDVCMYACVAVSLPKSIALYCDIVLRKSYSYVQETHERKDTNYRHIIYTVRYKLNTNRPPAIHEHFLQTLEREGCSKTK